MLIGIFNNEAHKRFEKQQSALKLSLNETFTSRGYSLLKESLHYAAETKVSYFPNI